MILFQQTLHTKTIIFANGTSLITFRQNIDNFCTTAIVLLPRMNERSTANKRMLNLDKTNTTEFIRSNYRETYVAASIF